MVSFSIKSNNSQVISKLMQSISSIKLDDIIFSNKRFSKYNNIILHYTGSNVSSFYNELANVICNCILDVYEPVFIRDYINSDYFYFDLSDLNKIEKNCYELLLNNIPSSTHFTVNKVSNNFSDRKIVLWTSILKYITANNSIVLDGFINFRISDYKDYLNSAIETAVSQFIIDKEYLDFIELLKLYISNSSPSVDLVHLVYTNGESILLDDKNNIIMPSSSSLNLNYLSDITFSSNDYTLNSLLNLIPKRILIHLIDPEDEFINTIKLIFPEQVIICSGCNLCKVYKTLSLQNFKTQS